jgi:DNA-binding protein
LPLTLKEVDKKMVEGKVEQNVADNTIFIGKKSSMAYVLAVMTQFSSGKNEVQIKARGRTISKAVDVAEIIRRRFADAVKVKNVEIGTEERENPNKGKVNVSTISITLSK